MEETKEHIKTRMLKNAARLWGHPETEAENSFDPLVSILLAACSTELEKISHEIYNSRARVLEKTVKLLAPDTLTGPLPAHAIASATPVENSAWIQEDTQFYISGKQAAGAESDRLETKDIFFSPTNSFRLNKASIRFMAAGNKLFKIQPNMGKEVMARSSTGTELPASTLWLGIDEPGVNLHETTFYFDFRNELNKKLFYYGLSKAKWYLGSFPLQHQAGYRKRDISGEDLDVKKLLDNEYTINDNIKKRVNAFYKPHCITLLDETNATSEKNSRFPEAIRNSFNDKETEFLHLQPIRWLCIKFPETISATILGEATCVMNCFPVINCRLHQINYRMQEIINIIPLETDDLFLDLDSVRDDSNHLISRCSMDQADGTSSAALMRNGGIGRFDERDAAAIIDHVLQLLRDESAAFSAMNHDFIKNEIIQLRQTINKLEKKMHSKQILRETTPYLIVHNNKKRPSQNLSVNYWSTHGKQGNQIKAGTRIQLYRGTLVNNNQAQLVSTTLGGRNNLSTTETVLAFKSALLSRERIITTEDIKAFCHYQLGNIVKKVDVKKGMNIPSGLQQGYESTIDVTISLHAQDYADLEQKDECRFWEANLTLLLEGKSAALMPFRVIIQPA